MDLIAHNLIERTEVPILILALYCTYMSSEVHIGHSGALVLQHWRFTGYIIPGNQVAVKIAKANKLEGKRVLISNPFLTLT